MKKILSAFLILTSCYAIGADVDNALLQKNLEAANTQIEVLKAQVEVMKSYQDNFLTTVYWSLATVLGIVVLLIGYNWFTNFKTQEREIEFLKAEILKEFNSSKQNLKLFFDDSYNKFLENIESNLNDGITKNIKPVKVDIHKIKKDLNHHKYLLLKIEFNEWMITKKVYGNAVSVAVELIEISMNIANEYYIEKSLEMLIDALEKGYEEKKKSTIDVNLTKEISEVLSKLNPHHESSKQKITSLIQKFNSL